MPPPKVYKLTIDHDGVHRDVRLRGKKRFVQERTFLHELVGNPAKERPVPDPSTDFFMLSDEQLDAYSAFRKKMKRLE